MVPDDSDEASIWRNLSTPPLRQVPENRTIPIVNVLRFDPDFSSLGIESVAEDVKHFVIMGTFQALEVQDGSSRRKAMPCLRSVQDVATFAYQMTEVRNIIISPATKTQYHL